jgi:hypothetical protein
MGEGKRNVNNVGNGNQHWMRTNWRSGRRRGLVVMVEFI